MTTLTPLRHEIDRGVITGRLNEVAESAVDIVAQSPRLVYGEQPVLHLPEPLPAHDGVYETLPLSFTRTAFRQMVERYSIPLKYADLLAEQQPGLLTGNINLRGVHVDQTTLYRLLRVGDVWRVRGVLSNQYQAIDNIDVLTAVVRGANRAGVNITDCQVEADWTDDRFRLRIAVPQIQVSAPELLGNYRSPYRQNGEPSPIIWAGLEVSNSETGGGAASVAPRAVILVCNNGMTRKADIVRQVHLGGRLEEGPVAWSAETRRAAVELIEHKMADAVNTFCSTAYLEGLVREMQAAKGTPVANVVAAFEVVQQRLGFSEDEVNDALNCFTKSGDTSVFGLGQAVTAMAQTREDGDRQSEIEQTFWEIVGQPAVFAGVKANA